MKKHVLRAMVSGQSILLIGFLVVTFAVQGFAQTAPSVPDGLKPGAVARSVEQPEPPAVTRLPEIEIEDEDGKRFKGAEGVTFFFNDVMFKGNRIFSSDDLEALITSYMGKEIEVNTLLEVTDVITRYYKEQGYFLSRAYIPPQSIKDMVLIKVREGRLGEIIIRGNKRYSREILRNTLKIVRGEGAVRTADVERGLLLLMDYPGLRVKATFKAGERPGLTDLVLDVKEEKILDASIDFNNYGNRVVTRDRLGATITAKNALKRGETFSVRGMFGLKGIDALEYERAELVLPLGYTGTRLGLFGAHMEYELRKEFNDLDFEGKLDYWGFWLSHPFIRTRNFSVWGDLGFDAKKVQQDILGSEVAKDDLRIPWLGGTIQVLDSLGGLRASTTFSARAYQGLSDVFGAMANDNPDDTVRVDSDINFNKYDLDLYRIQALPMNFSLLLKYHQQLTDDRVPSSEQISVGGAGSVRGYSQSEFTGDYGGFGTAELRVPPLGLEHVRWLGSRGKTIGETLQFAAFADAGWVKINDAITPEEEAIDGSDLGALGLGIRFAYSPWVQFKLDWAKSFWGDEPFRESEEEDGAWYFQGIIQY